MSIYTQDRISKYTVPQDRAGIQELHNKFTLTLALIAIIGAVIGIALQIGLSATETATPSSSGILGTGILFAASLVILVLIRNKDYETASNLLWIAFVGVFMIMPVYFGVLMLIGVITLITVAVLASPTFFLLGNLLIFIKLFVLLISALINTSAASVDTAMYLGFLIVSLAVVSTAARYFVKSAEDFTTQITRTATLLEGTVEVGQKAARILDQDRLLTNIVEEIRDRFSYYHVQVFLIDEERKYANLVASSGEIGKKLLNRGHRLAVGSQSVIGQVTQLGEPVIAADTGTSSVHARNELLPGTRAELALPIFDGDVIIGAMDVQSIHRNAFNETDTQALQVLANQTGIAIRNAQLFASQEESARVNERLLAESETNLEEIRLLNLRLTQRAWGDFLAEKSSDYGATATAEETIETARWSSIMREAVESEQVVSHVESNPTVAVPIVLRGAVIGAIEIRASGSELENAARLAEKVSRQLAISVENARLVEEAQSIAQREQHISDIATRYQSADTVEQLLKITLSELGTSLGATQSMIRLGRISEAENNGHQNGGSSA